MAKRPKRKVEIVQGVLFDVKEYTTGGTEVEISNDVFSDVEEIYGPTNSTDVGLLTNEIYCGDASDIALVFMSSNNQTSRHANNNQASRHTRTRYKGGDTEDENSVKWTKSYRTNQG